MRSKNDGRLISVVLAGLAGGLWAAGGTPAYSARLKGLGAFELTLAESAEKPVVSIGWGAIRARNMTSIRPSSMRHG